jgi:hypothetical protein
VGITTSLCCGSTRSDEHALQSTSVNARLRAQIGGLAEVADVPRPALPERHLSALSRARSWLVTLTAVRRWALIALIAIVAFRPLAAGGPAPAVPAAHVARVPIVHVALDPARRGRVVPRSFLGLSVEWDSVATYAGPPGHRRTGLTRLLAPLRRSAGGLALRVGGDTADQAWWNPAGRPRPPGVLQDVTPSTLGAIAWLARGLGGPVTLDVNLALRDARNALALARAARRRLPAGALDTVEIGNEPDLFTRPRTFHVPGHVHRRVRKRGSYGPAHYGRDAGRYLTVLAGLRPRVRLAVAGFAGPAWLPALPGLLRGWHGRAGALSGHLYGLPRCGGPAPSRAWLLSATASRGRALALAPLAATAARHRLPLRITELNSAACGGRPGLSDTFAAALWLTDTLFALLREGAVQADVHTWNHARYAPFAVGRGSARARPPLAGMDAFARAAPHGARLIAVRVRRRTALRAWATVDRGGTERVVLLARAAVKASLAAGGRPCATAWIATARGSRTARVCPRHGRDAVTLPARSLAVLTLPA